ncbi:uncharacterized protein [Leptinotarsa decemlineata]|uniref:uncharacterized protein n=1 Tax=Leptinotarsa decemlineata TaxID=7539 RepID=UPI003D307C60
MFLVLQINVGKGREATALLRKTAEERGAAVVCVQEPWIREPKWEGWVRHDGGDGTKVRTWVRNTVESLALMNARSMNGIGIIVGNERKSMRIINVYDEPGGRRNIRMEAIRMIFDEWEGRKILVGDVNAKNTAWGGNITDERGEDILDWVTEKGYTMENACGSPATFHSNRGESWVDLTVSENVQVNDWKVSMDETLSDHRMIEFTVMGLPKMKRVSVTNVRRTNWEGARANARRLLPRKVRYKRGD